MYEYSGAIHIHSLFSDGSGEIPEIALYAEETGLDFILITDHNTLRGKVDGFEKWYGKTLTLFGYEINDRKNQNHYLAFNTDNTYSTRLSAKEYVKRIKNDGGFGFIAHPHEKRSSMKEHPPYPWTEWESEDFTGIEIWNHMSEWMEGLTDQNKFNYFIHPLKSIISPPTETLEVWDKLNLKRKVVGIGGVDAHAHKVNMLGFFEFEVFPYKVLFKSIRTHILSTEELEISNEPDKLNRSREIIFNSLREGRSFISNSYHANGTGFRFYAIDGKNEHQMGDSFKLTPETSFQVILPGDPAVIKLLRNGEKIEEIENIQAQFQVDKPGAYRVEVYLNNNAWIFSNHIRIQ